MVTRLRNLAQMRSQVKKGVYFGDFVIVGKTRYQIVEYSFEGSSNTKGSRFVTFYNPYSNGQISIDYNKGTVDYYPSIIAWEESMSLDMKWLKVGLGKGKK